MDIRNDYWHMRNDYEKRILSKWKYYIHILNQEKQSEQPDKELVSTCRRVVIELIEEYFAYLEEMGGKLSTHNDNAFFKFLESYKPESAASFASLQQPTQDIADRRLV